MTRQRQVLDRVGARDQSRNLQIGVAATGLTDSDVLGDQLLQPGRSAGCNTGARPAPDTRFGSSNAADSVEGA